MKKKTFKDIDVSNKRVFVRVDFNVPQDENGNITDDSRITAAIPTIKYLTSHNAKVILASHLGRPNGVFNLKFSLKGIAEHLSALLGQEVKFATDVVGDSAKNIAKDLKPGEVMMLENVRFHKEEEENDDKFCKELAKLADIFVNDAFGTAHRAHATTAGISRYLPAVAGFLMSKEVEAINSAMENPEKPVVVIFGGAKVSDKIGVITKLLDRATTILIGGAMAYTFIVAKGGNVGSSRKETEKIALAKKILEAADKKNVKIVLPVDSVAVKEFAPDAKAVVVDSFKIPEGLQGVDIGPKAIREFKKEIKRAKTVIWNGPLGVYEFPRFKKGTIKIAKALAKSKSISLVGGGDSAAAINETGFSQKITHISTGGGATLEFLEGKTLPGVAVLEDLK